MNQNEMSTGKYLVTIAIISVFALFVYIAWTTAPNLKGYCEKEFRYLTDEEKIDSAIQYVLDIYPPVVDILEKQGEDIVRVDVNLPKKPIYYNSIEEFKSINKDCCRLSDSDRSGYQGGLYTRASGGLSTYVHGIMGHSYGIRGHS
jgi:hypothetical protein